MTTSRPRTSVLIVEDEGIIAQNLRELLIGFGYDVLGIASTSDQAMAYASERCPDVVLMDIRIKGKLDGIATAELLTKQFAVPIVYLTAHADAATIERAKQTQPFGYLTKPVRPDELRSAIEIARYKCAMEIRLRERERWLATTMRSIADAVVMVDLAGRITFLNPAAETLLGVTQSEALGRPAREVVRIHEADGTPLEAPLDRALREGKVHFLAEGVLEGRGGDSSVIISDSAAPVIDDKRLLGAVMVFGDVTEQKRLQKQIEVADRLASLGTMAAGVAHELNNPLAVVVGNGAVVGEMLGRLLSRLASEPGAGEGTVRLLRDAIDAQQDIVSAANRIAQIVRDLRGFSRPELPASGSLNVREAIDWALRTTAQEFRHRARVSTKLGNVPRIKGDETRVGQILVNLLINAAHAIAPGNVEANEVSIATRTDDQGRVVIEVTDTGCGIPPEALGRIFDPFFTTKAVGTGTGLGLSISHGIAASMGGTLTVDSRVGQGTTFRLTFPAAAEAETSASTAPVSIAEQRRGRVLVIDDEDAVLAVVARILRDHEVVCLSDAGQALARLKQDSNFDIILCDLMMPKMTGMEFYEKLLAERPEMAPRVVFVTGGAITAKSDLFLKTVPNERIQKPFGLGVLRAAVQRILAEGHRP